MNDCIAVVGAGLSGVSMAIQILHKNASQKVLLFEKNRTRTGRGIAYSGTLPYQPLNVVASKMSLFLDAPMHFYNWLAPRAKQYNINVGPDSFVKRSIYGDYVCEMLEYYIRSGRLEVINTAVQDIVQVDDTHCLVHTEAQTYQVNHAILATGVNEPKRLPFTDEVLVNAWDTHYFTQIKPEDDVLLIGTGLTMVDWVVSLKIQGHKGKIYAISRHGWLPMVHESYNTIQRFSPVDTNLASLVQDFKSSIKNIGMSWRQIVDELRPVTAQVWKSWSLTERSLFLNKLSSLWDIHRHKMPQESALHIAELIERGQFIVRSGRIDSIIKNADSTWACTYKAASKQHTIQAQHVINCTGPESNINKLPNPLFQHLIQKGTIQPDALNLGIEANHEGRVIAKDGTVLQNIWIVGPPRKAQLWESVALHEIRQQSANIADHIQLRQLQHQLHQLPQNAAPEALLKLLKVLPGLKQLNPELFFDVALEPTPYERCHIFHEPLGLYIMKWHPGQSSAIHEHYNFSGAVMVLKGAVEEVNFEWTDNEKLKFLQRTTFEQGDIALEEDRAIHMIRNVSDTDAAYTLHLYFSTDNSLENTRIFDLETRKIGILNHKALRCSWSEKLEHFKEISEGTLCLTV